MVTYGFQLSRIAFGKRHGDPFVHYGKGQRVHVNADDKFFRVYAFRNTHEFFAVVVENFFERSEQFRIEYPELYAIIVRLLNQDPIILGSPRAALSS